MKIRLNEIREEGENYTFNRNTAELNTALIDLIKNNPYSISLFIKPMNSKDFTVNGNITTKAPEVCATCGDDFELGIDKKINEILIPSQEQDRTGKYSKSLINSSEEQSNVSVTEYSKAQFDLGDFLHEAIALEIPYVARCTDCEKNKKNEAFIYDEKMSEETKPNPFQALKGIKLN